MYADPRHLLRNEIKVRFDDISMQAIDSLAVLTRKQRSAFIRDLVNVELKRRIELEASNDGCSIGSP